jgi:predicted porin
MKNTILKAAIAASLIVPSMVMAEATVYGQLHVSINQFDEGTATKTVSGNLGSGDKDLDMTSNTSAIGIKGSEDLGDGMKAIYKAEFQVSVSEGGEANDGTDEGTAGNALTQRDIFVGLKGGMGTIKFGTFSSNYKQMGGKVDSLYRTRLEGRGFLNTQSAALHGGRGLNRGRQTNTVQYSSPKMGGIQLVANTTVSGANDETNGVGVRWANKDMMVYVDWIDGAVGATTESAVKIGGKFDADAFYVAAQYEAAEDRTGYDFIHFNGGFNIDKNNAIILTAGQAAHINNGALDTTGIAVAYDHKMSKMTNVYVGYGDRSSDTTTLEDSVFTAGIKTKF